MTTARKRIIAISRIIICSIVAVTMTCILIEKVFSDRICHNIEYIEFERLDEKNPASVGTQIRIRNISNQNGTMWDLQDVAEAFEWVYDEDLESLAYYGTGEDIVRIDLTETSNLYISLLKQPSSGMVNIYIDGCLFDTYDLYSSQWQLETFEIRGRYNIPLIISLFIGIFSLLLISAYIYTYLLMDWRGHVRIKICLSLCWVIAGMIIVLVLGTKMYPQLEWKFSDGEYQDVELHDFVQSNGILHSTSGDPNIYLRISGQKVLVQSVSILGVGEIADSEWAYVFLVNDDYLGQEFFIKNGKNVVDFPMKLYNRNKASAIRIDLVSRADMDVSVSGIILNERKELVSRLLVTYILIVALLFLAVAICQLVYRKKQKELAILLLTINPIVIFSASNSLNGQIFSMAVSIWIWSYVVLVLWQIAFWALMNRPLISMGFTGGIWLTLAIINFYVTEFREMPLTFNDIYNARTAMTVAQRYTYNLPLNIIMSVGGSIGFWLLAFLLLQKTREKKKAVRILQFPQEWKGYLARMATAMSSIALIVIIIHSGEYGTAQGTLNVASTYMENGFILGFLSSNSVIEKPHGYQLEKAEEILSWYEAASGLQNTDAYPNIIMIMNESFSDLSVIHEFETNIEVMPVYDNLVDNVVKGRCFVSVVGGGTSNSEFEALTGNTMAFLPAGTNAYTQYCTGNFPSLVSYLKELDYECIALHPSSASNYNRNNVYRYMGFDKFLSISSFEGAEEIRHISDAATYEKIKELFEAKEDGKPLFIFDLTMQNHGGYGTSYNWEDPVAILGNEYPMSNEYLSSIHVSDQALGSLIEYFKKVEEPTVILFFGDHQPAIEDDFISDLLESADNDELIYRYITPYVIWANYTIQTQLDMDLSANYLATKLLETAGIPRTNKDLFLASLYEQLPIITFNGYMDSAGTWYNWAEESSYQQILEEYRLVQYAFFADRSEKAKEIFGR